MSETQIIVIIVGYLAYTLLVAGRFYRDMGGSKLVALLVGFFSPVFLVIIFFWKLLDLIWGEDSL